MEVFDLMIVVISLAVIAGIMFLVLWDRGPSKGDQCQKQNCKAGLYCSSNFTCEDGPGPQYEYGCDDGKCTLGLYCVQGTCEKSSVPPYVPAASFTNRPIIATVKDGSIEKKLYMGINVDTGNESFWSETDTGQRFSYSSLNNTLSTDGETLSINQNGLIVKGPESKFVLVRGSDVRLNDGSGNPLQIGQGAINGVALFSANIYTPIAEDQQTIVAILDM